MKTASEWVNPQLIQRLQEIDELKITICQSLQLEPNNISLWPVLGRKSLTVLTDSHVLATQLHYQKHWILMSLKKKHAINLTAMNIKFVSPTKARPIMKKNPTKPVKSVQNTVNSIAQRINDDDLRNALLNLMK
ncbi:MAG: hypothetical protein ACWA5U_09110 [bacterium]